MTQILGSHIVSKFDEELRAIFESVSCMAEELKDRIEQSQRAFNNGDDIAATKLIMSDAEINRIELEIAEMCSNVFMKRCPKSADLRFLIGVTHIIRDMERIGDLSQEIGKMSQRLEEEQQFGKNREVLRRIIQLCYNMFDDAFTSFKTFDAELAFLVIKQDEAINQELEDITRLLVTYMLEDSQTIKSNLLVSNAAQSYERIGDHVKNICESIIYISKGEDIRYRNVDDLESII